MNILIVCPILTDGGAERVCVSWANGLSARGHNVSILTRPNAKITYLPDDSVKVINLPKRKNPFLRCIPVLSATLGLRKLIKQNHYDVIVEVVYYLYFPIRFATWLSSPRIPIVFTSHSALERPRNITFPFKIRFVNFFTNKLYDYITVLTKRDAEILKSKGFKNVSVLHNPLFLEPEAINPEDKKKIVLGVGRVHKWFCKGFDLLILAWNRVYPQFQDWKLRIVGNASESSLKYLESLVAYKNSVEFVPYTPTIEKEYREASVFCLSSRYEGWGLVVAEAMSRGCAVIACDNNGRQAEIVNDGVSGLLCAPQNVDELSDKLKELLSDDNLRRKLQMNAPGSLAGLHESKIAAELEKILMNICQ